MDKMLFQTLFNATFWYNLPVTCYNTHTTNNTLQYNYQIFGVYVEEASKETLISSLEVGSIPKLGKDLKATSKATLRRSHEARCINKLL